MSETPQTPVKTLGKYQLRGELGKGAMGVVYLGFDPALEREVAIKVMGGATVSDSELKKRFEVEAKASAKLQHPNIVTVYDFGYDGQGAPYMAMELLKGQDLEQRIRRNPLTFREKLDVLAQTCRGLAHAHKNGIVHRDIKPANIFITDGGEAKIMDFGVARLQQSSHTQTGAVLGTADYMSPEQIRGAKVDGRSDIFSVGVILYRLLTNQKPFTGDNIQAVFFKVLNEEAPELVLPDGNDMPELQAIVDKALSKTAEERYSSADDLADDITDLIHLYQDVLNEDTVFDTIFDPTTSPDMETGTGSDGSGRRRTSSTGRVLGATSSGSRTHRPGTSYPTTGAGRTSMGMTRAGRTVAGRTTVSSPTRMMRGTQTGTMTGARPSVGIPVQESGGWMKYVAVATLLVGLGGAVFWFTQRGVGNGGAVDASPPAPPGPTIDVASQLALAERSLEAGQLSPALQAVDAILFAEPNHSQALALKDRINQAIDEMEATPATSTVPTPPPANDPPQGPSNSERAATLAADASLAIGAGELAQAEQLIRQGRQLDPGSPRWRQLDEQIARQRDQSERAAAAAKRQAEVDALVGEATQHLKTQSYEEAIAAYDRALAIDPNNAQVITARNAAQNAMQQAAAASVTSLAFQETKTQYVAPGQNDTPRGFEAGGGIQVNRATSAPENPAELIVQIHPATVQPGDPYFLRVRIHNQGNRPVGVKSIELVSTFGSRTAGKGQQLQPMVQRVNPRDTSLIWEVPGTWSEEQNEGSIQAIVTLIGDAKLIKTIKWQ